MPTFQASVPTSRAGRYLAQLCKHTGHLGALGLRHGHVKGAVPLRAECSDTDGTIEFGSGRATLHATGDALLFRIEADDMQHLQRIQEGLTSRLERIGRRDRLTITWSAVSQVEDEDG
jgi:hypothetical protein